MIKVKAKSGEPNVVRLPCLAGYCKFFYATVRHGIELNHNYHIIPPPDMRRAWSNPGKELFCKV
jgi:hypothetical protein